MSTKNVILGACAACFAVGSAVASVLNVATFQARRSDGLAFQEFIKSSSPCPSPSGTTKQCKVKIKTAGGVHTLSGYANATVYTAAGQIVVLTTQNSSSPVTITL